MFVGSGFGEKVVHLGFKPEFAKRDPFDFLEHRDFVTAQQALKGETRVAYGLREKPEQTIHGVVGRGHAEHAFIVSHQLHGQRSQFGPTRDVVLVPDGRQHRGRCAGSGRDRVFPGFRIQPGGEPFGRTQRVGFRFGRDIG